MPDSAIDTIHLITCPYILIFQPSKFYIFQVLTRPTNTFIDTSLPGLISQDSLLPSKPRPQLSYILHPLLTLLLRLQPTLPPSFAWLILTLFFKRVFRYNLLEGKDLPILRAEEMVPCSAPATAQVLGTYPPHDEFAGVSPDHQILKFPQDRNYYTSY